MELQHLPVLNQCPTYTQSCATIDNSLCQLLFAYALNDPVIILITLAVVIGSFCLLCGFILLYMVSKTLQDETSEAILLIGIGLFISSLACITWKLTNDRRLTQLNRAINEEAIV